MRRWPEAETFSQAALVETHRRGVERAEVVCAVWMEPSGCKGWWMTTAPMRCGFSILHMPPGYVSQIGQAVQAAGTALAPTWLTKQLHALKHDGPAQVLSDLRVLTGAHPDLEEVQGALAYLEKREGQMQYPTYQAAGWPIGSGSVESGHKVVMQARLKGAGMHWDRTHVNPLLALRTVECNDRWAVGWADVRGWHQRAQYRRRHARAEARLCACGQLCTGMRACACSLRPPCLTR